MTDARKTTPRGGVPAWLPASLLALLGLLSSTTRAAPDLSAFAALPEDPPPASTTNAQHYFTSNETRLDFFAAAASDRGGLQIGVGTEQNYVLAGWARPAVLVLVDFDQAIVDLQRVYLAAFRAAATKEEFLALWNERDLARLRAAVDASVVDPARRAAARDALARAVPSVRRRFGELRAQLARAHRSWFLTDDAQYKACRDLVVEGRVFVVRGDFTAAGTLPAIAAAARAADLRVGVLYLSNIEDYFELTTQVRANLTNLPFDDQTVVLRTAFWKTVPKAEGDLFHYNIQNGKSLQALITDPSISRAIHMVQSAVPGNETGLSALDALTLQAAQDARVQATKKRKAPSMKTSPPSSTSPSPSH